MTLSPLAVELRREILTWLQGNDPQTLTDLTEHPHRTWILDRVAIAVANSLRRGQMIQTQPLAADRTRGDEFFLMEEVTAPGALRPALVANLAGDRGFWRTQQRLAPDLEPLQETDLPA